MISISISHSVRFTPQNSFDFFAVIGGTIMSLYLSFLTLFKTGKRKYIIHLENYSVRYICNGNKCLPNHKKEKKKQIEKNTYIDDTVALHTIHMPKLNIEIPKKRRGKEIQMLTLFYLY